MTPERWQKIKPILEEALVIDPASRHDFLEKSCGDPDLLREAESLLKFEESEMDHLERSAFSIVTENGSAKAAKSFIGMQIGRYRIMSELGVGGMGAVYLAERSDGEFQQLVALKLIKSGLDSDSILRRFYSERQILASLDHPNIAHLIDGGTTDDNLPYFVMEYVKGETIIEFARSHDLSLVDRLDLFREVCGGVSFAHQNLVIHRDLKPSNILVNADGSPKLLDFGIAKLVKAEISNDTATQHAVFTPEYASPEQIRGEHLTTATDIYSLGVILYELLTGVRPFSFDGKSFGQIIQTATQTEPAKPSDAGTRGRGDAGKKEEEEEKRRRGEEERSNQFEPHISPSPRLPVEASQLKGDLDNIILKALKKEPERRYLTVEQFSEDIRRHLKGLPVFARQDTWRYRAGKFVRRNRTSVAAASLIFLALIGGIVATAWQARVARAEHARAERRFNEVRKLANLFMFKYHDGIAALPGSTELRKQLVKDAIDYLNSLASEASNDRELLRELGTAYHRIGDIQGGIMTSASGGTLAAANLGDTAGALESYRKAFVIRQKVAELEPSNKEMRQELGTSISRMGEISLTLGKPDEAMDYLRQAATIYENLSAADPSEKVPRLKLSSIYFTMGRIYGVPGSANLGDTQGALTYLRKAQAMDEALVAEDPTNAKYLQALAADYGNIGRVLLNNGDNQQALDCYRKALAIGEALAHEYPTNALYQRELSAQYLNVGNALLSLGDKSNALQNFRRALEIRIFLVAADPSDASIRRDLAVAHRSMGEALAASNDHDRARKNFDEAMKILTELAARDPKNAVVSYQQSLTALKFSIFLSNIGDTPGSRKQALLAVEVDEKLVAANPKDANARQTLALAYFQIGKGNAALASRTNIPSATKAHWQEARAWYQKSLGIWQDMRDKGTLGGADSGKPDEVAREIARCDVALDRSG